MTAQADIRASNTLINIPIDMYMQLSRRLWKLFVLCLADGKCHICGRTDWLAIHHIDEDKHNNCIANGMVLCFPCHNKWHGSLTDDVKGDIVDEWLMYLMSSSFERSVT